MRSFIVSPIAFEELEQAKDWYERINDNLGQAFFEDWKRVSDFIHRYPFHSQVRKGVYRYAYFKRFPYVIVYEVTRTEIAVFRVVHFSRHPRQRKKKSSRGN